MATFSSAAYVTHAREVVSNHAVRGVIRQKATRVATRLPQSSSITPKAMSGCWRPKNTGDQAAWQSSWRAQSPRALRTDVFGCWHHTIQAAACMAVTSVLNDPAAIAVSVLRFFLLVRFLILQNIDNIYTKHYISHYKYHRAASGYFPLCRNYTRHTRRSAPVCKHA